METYTKDEAQIKSKEIFEKILNGELFIYPTDTIYGIGCDATNAKAVQKVRKTKDRMEMPFSVIAPSIRWIQENCEISDESVEWLKKLPGPYTLILPLKNKDAIAKEVNQGKDSLGVRIPDHWISGLIRMIDIPIVTTSVNQTGRVFMTSLEELDSVIETQVGFAIDEGVKQGRPSKIVHLEGEEVKINER